MLTSNGYELAESPDRLGQLAETPDRERGDRDALWRRLRAQGYLLLRDQLPIEEVAAFRRFYFETLAPAGVTRPGTGPEEGIAGPGPLDQATYRQALFGHIVPSSEYDRLCRLPAIADWFGWFLGDDVHLHRRKILRHTRPGQNGIGTATQAHYDLVYLRDGTDRVLSMWIPLGDCPTTLGGLTYLEGSHRAVLAEEAEGRLQRPAASITADLPGLADAHDARWLVTDYRAGDVMIHSAHIIHAALDNVDPDGRMRLSTDIRYQRASEPIDWRWQQHWHDRDGL
ncbi:phytanoyl-CoA dioxygenase family protein [Occultella gossypii]|uniref:Phytanoyl-CoA dioxygenase family protein n=1 Tax=Occultella gossypii TaxID=2800820 RepID=A0ABS7SF32_9MICO|nr:phytanoyl-CoA dioxygenase family protein [Occultella gossypii]MBZ2198966.1 phytanoyl-CoA dioxygenase family protein [Occultella gossypii]